MLQQVAATLGNSGLDALVATLNGGDPQIRSTFLSFYTDGGKDKVNLSPYYRKQLFYFAGYKNGVFTRLKDAAGFVVTSTSSSNHGWVGAQFSSIPDYLILLGLEPVDTVVEWNTGLFDEVVLLYTDQPETETPKRVKFLTILNQHTFKDTMLIGMEIALVFCDQIPLNTDQYGLNYDVLTIDGGVGVAADKNVLIIPSADVSDVLTTVAGERRYDITSSDITAAYVVYGNTILAPTQYTLVANQIVLDDGLAVVADKQLVIVAESQVTEVFTTVAAQTTYTSVSLNGIVIDYVLYGNTMLAPSQYSLSGKTITLNLGFAVEGGKKLVIKKI